MRHKLLILLYALLAFFILGCGGGGGDTTGAGATPPTNAPQVQTATTQLQSELARAVPSHVTHLRLTGFDSSGQVRYGPQTKRKAAIIDFLLVPVSVKRVQVEFLDNERVVGIGLRDVTPVVGQIAVIVGLDFKDVKAVIESISIEPSSLTLAKGTTGELRVIGRFDDVRFWT